MKIECRKTSGSFMVTAFVSAILVILPLGLYAFEVARLNLAAFQLRVATDAAALAGAIYMQDVNFDDPNERSKAKEAALAFLKRNLVSGVSLANTQVSQSVEQDSPISGGSSFDLHFNKDSTVTAVAAFGLQPAFAKFLGLDSVPVRVNSTAGPGGLIGDICIVVDLSGSMEFGTRSVIYGRSFSGGKLRHSIAGNTSVPPSFGEVDSEFVIPDPNTLDFTRAEKFKKFANAPFQVKLAALVEAKRGNLESIDKYKKGRADRSVLADFNFIPEPGYQDEYQKLALSAVQPLSDEKDVLADFLQRVGVNPDAHFSLITYSTGVSTREGHDSYSTRAGFRHPRVDLNNSQGRSEDINAALAPAPTFRSTATGDAVLEAIKMLNGDQHRAGVQKSIVLLTDGMANHGSDPIKAAKLAGQKDIKLYTVGFFHTKYSQTDGKKLLNNMVAAAGNGSKNYFAPDIPTLKEVLHSVANGDVSLINKPPVE